MAIAMREAAGKLITHWRERGRDLGFGAGIAQGYATLGQIGFSERSGYTAIGTVCNVAARLCAEAKDGQILVSQLINVAVKGSWPRRRGSVAACWAGAASENSSDRVLGGRTQ
jgi:class 3 adenylate cyclase